MQDPTGSRMLEAVAVPVVLIGIDRRIIAINARAAALLTGGAPGRHYQVALRQPALVAAVEAALAGGTPGVARHVLSARSGEAVYRVVVSPLDPGPGSALCTFEDVSEAEQMGQMRRDFVANVSHELRTPLTALLGFIETLQGAARDDAAARARFLDIMAREAARMSRLVSDLLSLSRVEAEERVRPTGAVDIAEVVSVVAANLRSAAEAAGVVIAVEGPEGPAMVRADFDQMTQVLSNLMENAVKHGGAGGRVTVSIAEVARDPSLRVPAIAVTVADAGEGIDALHLPRLTERFYRVDADRSRQRGGTGLGLAIVKHIVNRHRGRLAIESTRGAGSRFIVVLEKA